MATVDGQDAQNTDLLPAISVRPTVIRKRADFLRAARAKRAGQPGLLLQARNRADDDTTIRVGYTCSKKIGNSVIRNRAKRRLREIARELLPVHGKEGWDYVLVGRPGKTIEREFDGLRHDLKRALEKIHQ